MSRLLFDSDGQPLGLGKRIGKGGEGEVFELLGKTDIAVKFYTIADANTREAKLRKMIADGLAKRSQLIAFPISLVRDKSGMFVGFTMMRVSGHQQLFELYSPG